MLNYIRVLSGIYGDNHGIFIFDPIYVQCYMLIHPGTPEFNQVNHGLLFLICCLIELKIIYWWFLCLCSSRLLSCTLFSFFLFFFYVFPSSFGVKMTLTLTWTKASLTIIKGKDLEIESWTSSWTVLNLSVLAVSSDCHMVALP